MKHTKNDSEPGPAEVADEHHGSTTVPHENDAEKAVNETKVRGKQSVFAGLGWLDRLLALWLFLAIALGMILGALVPSAQPTLQRGEFVGVSIPIAVGLLVMMYPILCKVRFEKLHRVFAHRQIWIQLLFSIVVNWIIAPLVMVIRTSSTSCPRGVDSLTSGCASLRSPGHFYLMNQAFAPV